MKRKQPESAQEEEQPADKKAKQDDDVRLGDKLNGRDWLPWPRKATQDCLLATFKDILPNQSCPWLNVVLDFAETVEDAKEYSVVNWYGRQNAEPPRRTISAATASAVRFVFDASDIPDNQTSVQWVIPAWPKNTDAPSPYCYAWRTDRNGIRDPLAHIPIGTHRVVTYDFATSKLFVGESNSSYLQYTKGPDAFKHLLVRHGPSASMGLYADITEFAPILVFSPPKKEQLPKAVAIYFS
jgi:hypothetical protein